MRESWGEGERGRGRRDGWTRVEPDKRGRGWEGGKGEGRTRGGGDPGERGAWTGGPSEPHAAAWG